MKDKKDLLATLAGVGLAFVTGSQTIDVSNFDLTSDWKSLIIPVLILVKGWFVKFK